MSKLIVVLGATGKQGGSVARTFAALPGWRVRGVTRNPSSASAQALVTAAPGVELVAGDLDSADSLTAAFAGAHAIFGVTDFWQFMRDPATAQVAQGQGISTNEAAFNAEIQHGRNIVDAAAREAVAEGAVLERLVMSTLSDSRVRSGGKFTWNYHFEGKAKVTAYLKERAAEDAAYAALLAKTSWVQVGYYMDNWQMNSFFSQRKQPDGTFLMRSAGSNRVPWVYPPTDTGPFVEALVLKAPANTVLLGASELLSMDDYAKLWSRLTGKECKWQPITPEAMREVMPGDIGKEIADSAGYVAEFGWDGGEGAKLPADVGVDLSKLKKLEEYIRETDWSPIF